MPRPRHRRGCRCCAIALSSGQVGQAQFHAIRVGLGEPPVDRYPNLEPGLPSPAWAERSRYCSTRPARCRSRSSARPRGSPGTGSTPSESRSGSRSASPRVPFAPGSTRTVSTTEGSSSTTKRPRGCTRSCARHCARAEVRGSSSDRRVGSQARRRRTPTQTTTERAAAVRHPRGSDADRRGRRPAQAFGDRQPGVRIWSSHRRSLQPAPAARCASPASDTSRTAGRHSPAG